MKMRRTRNSEVNVWFTPRVLFLIAFLCCIAVAKATDQAPIDPRFGSASADLARKFQSIKASLPHDHIPSNAEQIKDTSSWGMDYAISIVKVVGPGFAISILSLLIGILYGIFKLCRMCCCPRKQKDDDDEDEREPTYYLYRQWIPTGFYFVAFVFLLTGMVFGIMNNPRFSDGVVDLGNYVVSIGDNALDLGNGLIDSLHNITALIPASVTEIFAQLAGVPALSTEVVNLGDDVNSTSAQVSAITAKVAAIDAGNTSAVASLLSQLSSINNSSQQVIAKVSDLTFQIADKLNSSMNSVVGNLNNSMTEINSTVGEIEDTANGVIDQAADLVDKIDKYVDDTKNYDKSRQKAVTALFSLVITVTVSFFVGYIIGVKVVLNIVTGFGFAFLFLLWLSGSIHFLLGMALNDVCPVVDTVIQGILPNDTQAAVVLQGCLYDHRSVLDSLNITAFNLSDVFDYKNDFDEFTDFANSFNFSTIDGYLTNLQTLQSYNLTAVANNLTAENFGWNQSVIYTVLDALNNQTSPDVYGLNNYTSADPNHYPPPKNQTVYDLKGNLTALIDLNTTIYNKIDTAKAQLIDAQHDIDNLMLEYSQFDARYDAIKGEVDTLKTDNVSHVIGVIDNVQNNITAFFQLGNCSFLGDTYQGILLSLCGTMQPAIDLLTIAQFLAGIALIPMVIIAEVLSFRVADGPNIFRALNNSVDEEYGSKPNKGETSVYATVSKNSGASVVTRPALSATIASSTDRYQR